MIVQILVDNRNSWYVPFAHELKEKLNKITDSTSVIHDHSDVKKGDILCLVSCEKIFRNLELNHTNIVVHESDLPKGKGWSPVSWQVLEGINSIPVTLFEANKDIDSGIIYFQDFIELDGLELLDEIKTKQGLITNRLIEKFIASYPVIKGRKQVGKSTFYKKRTSKDSELDINKTIKEQFNLLRIVDNKRYPAYFTINGKKYTLKINKNNE